MKYHILFAIIILAGTAQHLLSQQAGTIRENSRDGLKYVWVPPGTFMMGCSPRDQDCEQDEKPAHRVSLSRGFWMGQTLVTVRAYKRFVADRQLKMPLPPIFDPDWKRDDTPITNVSWNDAHDFCAWTGGRLPTEAEWEYAARAGSTGVRYGKIDDIAWYFTYGVAETHAVAEKRPNAFGLFDMLGNVWELLNDWYAPDYYQNSPSQDPTGPGSGQFRVLRGGSWFEHPRYVKTSFRFRDLPGNRYDTYGFRCVREGNGP
jgi:formylglycine-generating enzyme required for sulfatase activity